MFRIDIDTCQRCGGKVRIIASLSEPAVIVRILAHLAQQPSAPPAAAMLRRARAPPLQAVLDLE